MNCRHNRVRASDGYIVYIRCLIVNVVLLCETVSHKSSLILLDITTKLILDFIDPKTKEKDFYLDKIPDVSVLERG